MKLQCLVPSNRKYIKIGEAARFRFNFKDADVQKKWIRHHKNDNQFGNSLINQDRTLGWRKCITILIGPSLSSALKMQQTANNIRRITMRCYIQENAWLEAQITKRTNRTT